MTLIGYLHFRDIDAIRWPVYSSGNEMYYIYKGVQYRTPVLKYTSTMLDITLTKTSEPSNKLSNLEYYWINEEKYQCKDKDDFEIPQEFQI